MYALRNEISTHFIAISRLCRHLASRAWHAVPCTTASTSANQTPSSMFLQPLTRGPEQPPFSTTPTHPNRNHPANRPHHLPTHMGTHSFSFSMANNVVMVVLLIDADPAHRFLVPQVCFLSLLQLECPVRVMQFAHR